MPAAAPGAIASVTATATTGKITVTWTASSDATMYLIQRSVDSGATWTTLKSNQTGLSYTDTAVTKGVTYRYRVRGRNSSAYGPFTTGANVTAK